MLAKDLVEELRQQALEQFDVPVHLETTAEEIAWEPDPEDASRQIVVLQHDGRRDALAGGDHRRRPRGVRAEAAAGLRHDAVGGTGCALPGRREGGVRRQAGADRRRW